MKMNEEVEDDGEHEEEEEGMWQFSTRIRPRDLSTLNFKFFKKYHSEHKNLMKNLLRTNP